MTDEQTDGRDERELPEDLEADPPSRPHRS